MLGFPGSSLLMVLIRIGLSSAAHERLIKSVEWCWGVGARASQNNSKLKINQNNNLKFAKTRLLVAELTLLHPISNDTFLSFWLPIPFIPASSSTPER